MQGAFLFRAAAEVLRSYAIQGKQVESLQCSDGENTYEVRGPSGQTFPEGFGVDGVPYGCKLLVVGTIGTFQRSMWVTAKAVIPVPQETKAEEVWRHVLAFGVGTATAKGPAATK